MSIQNYKRDFFKEAHQLLKQQGYKNYIQGLLPGGKWQSGEYVVLNPTRNDSKAGSFSINGSNGKWSDFAIGEAGNDLIGLTAYVKGIAPLEACYHIGVPRHNKINSQEVTKQIPKEDSMKINQDSIEELPPISQEILDELTALTEERRESTEEVLAQEPPAITPADTGYHNERTFKCFPSAFFPYKNSLGVTVGYIARWDVQTEGGENKKGVRPYIYDFKEKKWISKFFGTNPKNSRPLYNLPQILERKDTTILIVEGEKTAEAAKLLFPELVASTSSGGAQQVKQTEWFWLRGRDIIIAPDEGKAGDQYLEQVIKTLEKEGVNSVRILEPLTLGDYVIKEGIYTKRNIPLPHGYDLADSLAEGWTPELIQQAQLDKQFYPFFKERRGQIIIKTELRQNEEVYEFGSKTYKLTPVGLYTQYFVQATAGDLANDPQYGEHDHVLAKKEAWRPLCGYLKPTYKVKDVDNSWGMLVKFKDLESVEREVFLKRTDWLGEKGAVEILQDRGLQLMGLKQKDLDPINEYLNKFTPEFKAIGVDMVGWQGDNETYMLPFANEPRNSYLAKKDNKESTEYILQQKGVALRVLKKKGTLEEWKRTVGRVCRGNHLHSFAILVSLTAPALKLLGEEGGFFHYVGSTSVGKSTLLEVSKSVWGYENLGSFRVTDSSLESTCKNANDGVIFLDEIAEAKADDLFKIVYMLANGVTKGRADRNGNAKSVTHFTVLAQSTGEIGLEAKLAENKIQTKGGLLMRMAELDADRGKGLNTFDVLNVNHDTGKLFTTGREQAEYLKKHAKENCGVVVDGLLKAVVPNVENYKKMLEEAKTKWLERNLTGGEGVEMARMAKRFSTIFASGVVAIKFGIIPHSLEEIERCVDSMFKNWLERFGGDSPHEFKMMVADLRKLCVEQQYSRFCNAHPTEDERVNLPHNKAGRWKMEEVRGEDGKMKWVLSEYWVDTAVFDREVIKGRDKKAFFPLLVENGYVLKEDEGKYGCVRRPAKEKSQRFIVVPASAFFDEQTESAVSSLETQTKNVIIMDGVEFPVNDYAE